MGTALTIRDDWTEQAVPIFRPVHMNLRLTDGNEGASCGASFSLPAASAAVFKKNVGKMGTAYSVPSHHAAVCCQSATSGQSRLSPFFPSLFRILFSLPEPSGSVF